MGIDARVLSSRVVAWVGSSSEVAPFLNRDSAMVSASSCSLALVRVFSIRTSSVRMRTYVRATSAVSEMSAA